MKKSEMIKYLDFDNKVYEKNSMREVLKKFEKVTKARGLDTKNTLNASRSKITADLYAYKDSNGRWRAGRLAKQNKGQFITGKSARSLRGNATKQLEKIAETVQMMNQTNTDYETVNKALDKKVELTRKYRENKKLNPNVASQTVYGNTVQDVFGTDYTQS